MFSGTKPFASFAVDDVVAARQFYGETLGMSVSEEGHALVLSLPDDHAILVYPKPDHTPASFTVLNFPVSDVEKAVADLAELGLSIERFDGVDTDDKGISRGEGPPTAWFKDPAGNILSVMQVLE